MKKILIAGVMTLGMVTNANAFDINFNHNQNIMTEHFIGQVVKQLFPHKIVTNNAIVYTGSVANKHVRNTLQKRQAETVKKLSRWWPGACFWLARQADG